MIPQLKHKRQYFFSQLVTVLTYVLSWVRTENDSELSVNSKWFRVEQIVQGWVWTGNGSKLSKCFRVECEQETV